jgi:hypothetical protein
MALASARREKEKDTDSQQERKIVAGEIRPDCSTVGLNLGDYSPRVHQRAPAEKENKDLRRLSDRSAVR